MCVFLTYLHLILSRRCSQTERILVKSELLWIVSYQIIGSYPFKSFLRLSTDTFGFVASFLARKKHRNTILSNVWIVDVEKHGGYSLSFDFHQCKYDSNDEMYNTVKSIIMEPPKLQKNC